MKPGALVAKALYIRCVAWLSSISDEFVRIPVNGWDRVVSSDLFILKGVSDGGSRKESGSRDGKQAIAVQDIGFPGKSDRAQMSWEPGDEAR